MEPVRGNMTEYNPDIEQFKEKFIPIMQRSQRWYKKWLADTGYADSRLRLHQYWDIPIDEKVRLAGEEI